MAARDDPQFAKEVLDGTEHAIAAYQLHQLEVLEEELSKMPWCYRKGSFRQHIIEATPILALRARVEKMLWHQRLDHPYDEYLYNAHKTVNGIPKFASQNSVLDQCPTCIKINIFIQFFIKRNLDHDRQTH